MVGGGTEKAWEKVSRGTSTCTLGSGSLSAILPMQPRSISQDDQVEHNKNARGLDIRRASPQLLKMECRRCDESRCEYITI